MSGGDPGPTPDPDLRAAEYVLGTLEAGERAVMAREAERDPALDGRIRAWEARLAPLAAAVAPVAPPTRVRDALLQSLRGRREGAPDPVGRLRRQVRRWQGIAAGAGLLAAGLALFITVGPSTGPGDGRYIAVVQGGGALPALIVRVDTRSGTAQVRPVGADAPAGRSLELWYVGAAGAKPLGLVGTTPSRVTLPPGASQDGVIAVSVEPPGGSPSGQPTGPVIYTGKLIAE
ncbi:anti-sigma factor [Methylobacterium sp. NEAU 140]|uniref:anti-sigma factor n=1 Tax=Methylobacterium sp. NEAU 140 TaxID=3064945 RepID=UPI002733A2EB|nr:anti-sigma factor [Methylobacterium sp. NEAU 140]MDP4025152.1 anti-sigma factor [Methylobacterium sp. NEAU 140]